MEFFDLPWYANAMIATLAYAIFGYGLAWAVYYIYYISPVKEKFLPVKIQPEYTPEKTIRHEKSLSAITILIHGAEGGLAIWLTDAGFSQAYSHINEYGIMYFILSVVAMIVLHDAYFYWTHRFMHLKWVYPIVHKFHHKSLNPSPWAAHATSPWESAMSGFILVIFVMIFPTHWLALTLFVGYMTVWNVFGHNGFEMYPRGFSQSWFGKWNTTVTHHNLHHKYFHGNYGIYFNWWDRWMGTEREEYHQVYNETFNREKTDLTSDKHENPAQKPVEV